MEIIKLDRIDLLYNRGLWVMRINNSSIYEIDKEFLSQMFPFWLPMLEYNPTKIALKVDHRLKELNIADSFLKSFPVHKLIRTGLKSDSFYWISKAFFWLEELGFREEFREELQFLLDDPTMKSQKKFRDRVRIFLKIPKMSKHSRKNDDLGDTSL